MSNIHTVWNGAVSGIGTVQSDFLKADIAIDEVLGGSGQGTNPKEILAAAAVSCMTLTLTTMLNGRKIPLENIDVDTKTEEDDEGKIMFHHTVTVELEASVDDSDLEIAEKTIGIADRSCPVGSLLRKAGVHIETEGKAQRA